ncbi:hypothetical protein HYV50_05255 [Candidatus Pacearchaeota archaeon]|nr:hypothetical protein [Candidatus Pacearchaeota archaeon]
MKKGNVLEKEFDRIDKKIIQFLKKNGLVFLKYSLALVFIWFGILKSFNLSPANELVANTVYWFDPNWFVPFLGWWEVLIGVCLLYHPLTRIGLALMAVQMAGTFLPLIILPEVAFSKPFVPTLEGQYIIKNLVLIGAAMIIGSHLRDKKM